MDIYQQLRDWMNHIPARYRSTWRKAYTKRHRQAAIRAKCQDCQNWQVGEVRGCDVVTCPLWFHRPSIHPEQQKRREEVGEVMSALDELDR